MVMTHMEKCKDYLEQDDNLLCSFSKVFSVDMTQKKTSQKTEASGELFSKETFL